MRLRDVDFDGAPRVHSRRSWRKRRRKIDADEDPRRRRSPDRRSISLDGEAYSPTSPADAARSGIVCIFQELSVIPDLSVAANICLADPPRTRLGLIDRKNRLDGA